MIGGSLAVPPGTTLVTEMTVVVGTRDALGPNCSSTRRGDGTR
jgi:hypothetical protein